MEDEVHLSEDQLKAIEAVKAKKNVFITGSAGVGKSFVLQEIRRVLPKSKTYITASTGVAACNIGGITVYSFAGIGLGKEPVDVLVNKIRNQRRPARKRWEVCQSLIIDEISMISGELFIKLEAIARKVRGVEKPFGGVQLILCGDFFQLPPVNKNGENSMFCFETEAWRRCVDVTVALKYVFRQKDEFFIQLLNRVRYGNVTEDDEKTLEECKSTVFDTSDGIKPTLLFPHRASCERTNESELSRLPGPTQRYESIDSGIEEYVQQLDRHSRYAKVLDLRVGAQVMLLTNVSVSTGLVNGARGVVTGFYSEEEYRDFGADMEPVERFPCVPKYPIVRFVTGSEILITREASTIDVAGKVVASRMQLPLALAWAVSIHKSQGITLERCEMSLKDVFAAGQAYVALSRVTGIEGLKIRDINVNQIFSSEKVKQYYEGLGFRDSDIKFCPTPKLKPHKAKDKTISISPKHNKREMEFASKTPVHEKKSKLNVPPNGLRNSCAVTGEFGNSQPVNVWPNGSVPATTLVNESQMAFTRGLYNGKQCGVDVISYNEICNVFIKNFERTINALYSDHSYCKMDPAKTSFGQPFDVRFADESNQDVASSSKKLVDKPEVIIIDDDKENEQSFSQGRISGFTQESKNSDRTFSFNTAYPGFAKASTLAPHQIPTYATPTTLAKLQSLPSSIGQMTMAGCGSEDQPMQINRVSITHDNNPHLVTHTRETIVPNPTCTSDGASRLTPEQRQRMEESRLKALQRRRKARGGKCFSTTFLTAFS